MKKVFKRSFMSLKKGAALYAVLITIVFLTHGVSQAANNRSAPVSKFDGVDEIVEECTNTTTFANIPQMTRTFSLGGSTNDEVVVMFQGSIRLDDSGGIFDTGFIRLQIDGVEQAPGLIPIISPNDSGTHGFNWQSKPLSPGSHTARVQWRTDLGSTFCVDARSLIILHK
ncbi:MAG TPA: hypothetical protein VLB01_04045 [Thermodesulfobacteriota bacterium]|nr:hypothetical protein [Thermodesulfobacteriota bacterium]